MGDVDLSEMVNMHKQLAVLALGLPKTNARKYGTPNF